ncbi:MAG: hypothetical protein AAFY11_16340, partial [Cyanobacteria bacterium J06641_5]
AYRLSCCGYKQRSIGSSRPIFRHSLGDNDLRQRAPSWRSRFLEQLFQLLKIKSIYQPFFYV